MIYSENLSAQLQNLLELYALDTAEMAALTAWESTVMASPSQSSYPEMRTLYAGYETLSKTIAESSAIDLAITSMLQAMPNVRFAPVIRRAGKPTKVKVFLK